MKILYSRKGIKIERDNNRGEDAEELSRIEEMKKWAEKNIDPEILTEKLKNH